jgi:hypothetical protein
LNAGLTGLGVAPAERRVCSFPAATTQEVGNARTDGKSFCGVLAFLQVDETSLRPQCQAVTAVTRRTQRAARCATDDARSGFSVSHDWACSDGQGHPAPRADITPIDHRAIVLEYAMSRRYPRLQTSLDIVRSGCVQGARRT